MLRRALEGFQMAIPDGRLNDVQETSEYDIAIIGAGVAGLTATLFAARLGHSTLMFDHEGHEAHEDSIIGLS
jgi:ribulose 1,5-bisphosphate synthetase/thiazole synthase